MRASYTLFLAAVFTASASASGDVNLVDFSAKHPVVADNCNIQVGEDFILPGLNPRSTSLDRVVRSAETSVTYDLSPKFKFENYPGYELCLWVHIDGLPGISPGTEPFSRETHAWLVNIDLLDADGDFVYRSKETRLVSRGWNELKFALVAGPPQNEHVTPDFPVHRRAFHFEKVGTPGRTIAKAKIRFDADENVTRVRLNSFKLQKVDSCQIVMVFDDGYKGVYDTVAPLLAQRNLKASLAMIGNRLNDNPPNGSMGRWHATALYYAEMKNGRKMFDFVNHSWQHRPLHDATDPWTFEELLTEIKKGQNALTNLGFTRNDGYKYLVYPGGAADAQVFAAAAELGIPFARGGGFDGDPNGDTHSIRNQYWGTGYDAAAAENGINGFNPEQAVEQFKDWLDEGVIEGAPRHIIWHDVSRQMKSFNVANNWNSTAFFTEIVDYIARLRNQGKVEVMTLPEWHQGLDHLHRMNAVNY
ncbi:MAG: polysaccharide deacetylase family protein [Armatimonadetes bacterium]|nr:polysaccharide deacetylase family protein [Armatimonadota bacterium]